MTDRNLRPSLLRPVVRSPLQCRVVLFAGDVNRFLATGIDTGGSFAQWEVVVPPRGGPRPHVHSREVETVLVLEGTITLDIGGQRLVATVGDFVVLPTGVPHAFRNESATQAVLIVTVAPAGLERFFFDVGQEVPGDSVGLPVQSAEEDHRMLEAAATYGIRFVEHTSLEISW
jgi:quercetin dioxygenase-like cupin family protein